MTARQLENLIKIGTVQEVDPVSNRIRVQHGVGIAEQRKAIVDGLAEI